MCVCVTGPWLGATCPHWTASDQESGPVGHNHGWHCFALDLTFSATQVDDGPPGAHLQRCNAAKVSRYNTTLGGALPRGTQLVPVTYAASRPFLHSNGVHRLYRAVTATAALTCSQDSPAWGFHLSAATFECASCLGRVFATWLWRQAFACCPW